MTGPGDLVRTMGQSWHCRLLSALSPAYNRRYRAQAMKRIKRAADGPGRERSSPPHQSHARLL